MSAPARSVSRLWDGLGDPGNFCHYTVADEPFPSPVPMLCGLLLDPEDYAPDSLQPDCPVCIQLGEYYQ
jgi:hypothetical protein